MIRRLLTRAVLRINFETYYCASCGGWYPIEHFSE